MNISVVIPVYNAACFLERAVCSALDQFEVGEIVLVEDGSTDPSLSVCSDLAARNAKVRVYQHSDKGNHGAGASRSLGARLAAFEWIAFLDADDYFLANRFVYARKCLLEDPTLDGVFDAVGIYADTPEGKKRYLSKGGEVNVGIKRLVAPAELFENYAPIGDGGYSLPTGTLVRRTALERIGWFEDRIRIHEDTVTNIKLAAICRMAVGSIDNPVAMRGLRTSGHLSDVRSMARHYVNRNKMWALLCPWGREALSAAQLYLLQQAAQKEITRCYDNMNCRVRGRAQCVKQLFLVIVYCPRLLQERFVINGFLKTFLRP